MDDPSADLGDVVYSPAPLPAPTGLQLDDQAALDPAMFQVHTAHPSALHLIHMISTPVSSMNFGPMGLGHRVILSW